MDRNDVKSFHGLAEKIAAKKSIWIVLYALICTLLLPSYFSDSGIEISNGLIPLAFLAVVLVLLRKYYSVQHDKRENVCAHILGFMFSCMLSFGYAISHNGEIMFSNWRLILSIVLYTHLIAAILSFIWRALIWIEQVLSKNEFQSVPLQKCSNAIAWLMKHPVCIVLLLLLCWTPCYLSNFPGGFHYDATTEFDQLKNGYIGSFPLLHSVIITRLLSATYRWFGSYEAGVAIYVVLQMILFAIMYTQILATFHKRRTNNLLLGGILLYCAAFPVIAMLVTDTVRDVLFGGLLTYTCFLVCLFALDKKAFLQSRWKPICLGVVIVLTIFARSNGGWLPFVFIALLCSVIWWFNRKECAKGVMLFSGAIVVFYIGLSVGITVLCQPFTPRPKQESLAVVFQALGRAYVMNSEKWTEDEIAELYKYVDFKEYVPECADAMKGAVKPAGDDLGNFVKYWIKMGLKYPSAYVESWIATTAGMWYPNSIIDGYNDYVPWYRDFSEKCYFGFAGSAEAPVKFMGLLPKLQTFYENIGLHISFEKIPIISLIFSIGFHVWIVLNSAFYALYRRNKHLYPSIGILLVYIIALLFVPIILLRYFAALFFAFPLTILFTLQPGVGRSENEATEVSEA